MHARRSIPVVLLLLCLTQVVACPFAQFHFTSPAQGFLSAPGDVSFGISVPAFADPASLQILLDGQPVPATNYTFDGSQIDGVLVGTPEGPHQLVARIKHRAGGVDSFAYTIRRNFTLVALEDPDDCDVLNGVSCILPFPSARFEEAASTETGVRIAYGPTSLPLIVRLFPLPPSQGYGDPTAHLRHDGFSPTVQVVTHFPTTPDLAASGAPTILPSTRTYDARGTEADSPTLLIDADTGERVLHWVENDGTASNAERVVTFLRPATSLTPGKRYIVAFRNLVGEGGTAVEAEPVFRAIRDGAPSDLPAVEARRDQLDPVLARLEELGVDRRELQLAWDFQVRSDHNLTYEMLSMRDQAFAWLDTQREACAQTFTVDEVDEVNPGCSDPDEPVWRHVSGTFQVPLFLANDPFTDNAQIGRLVRDASGLPSWSTTTDAPFGISIPCAAFDDEGDVNPLAPFLIGHGLFGEGAGTARGIASSGLVPDLIPGATNWAGMSSPDTQPSLLESFIFKVVADPDNTDALADRLRQGQANTLVLARMMHEGDFNADPAFQGEDGTGVLLADDEIYYWGASLGGIQGHLFAGLTPTIEKLVLDVPAINFSLILQRATPFLQFEALLDIVTADRMDQAVGLGLSHELWVPGDPSALATHITSDPLPGSIPKKVLLHVALHDQQVSNLGSQLAGASQGIPVHESSVMQDLAGMSNSTGPQDSAYMVIDTAAFDLTNPDHLPFVPPLINDQAIGNGCDPHNRLRVTPAAVDQIRLFLRPGGRIETTCTDDGVCNASAPDEFPFGVQEPCDPLS